ncbi:MAG: hypothetical protein AB8F74_20180 [Saprospiraceae bacterium]
MKKQLLEKYWKGETTLEEEQWLRTNISKADPLTKEERKYFEQLNAFVELQSEEQFDMAMFDEQPKAEARVVAMPFYNRFQKVAVVIALLLAVGVGTYQLTTVEEKPLAEVKQEVENPNEAFEIAKASLLLISQKMNKGAAHIGALEKFEDAHDKINSEPN